MGLVLFPTPVDVYRVDEGGCVPFRAREEGVVFPVERLQGGSAYHTRFLCFYLYLEERQRIVEVREANYEGRRCFVEDSSQGCRSSVLHFYRAWRDIFIGEVMNVAARQIRPIFKVNRIYQVNGASEARANKLAFVDRPGPFTFRPFNSVSAKGRQGWPFKRGKASQRLFANGSNSVGRQVAMLRRDLTANSMVCGEFPFLPPNLITLRRRSSTIRNRAKATIRPEVVNVSVGRRFVSARYVIAIRREFRRNEIFVPCTAGFDGTFNLSGVLSVGVHTASNVRRVVKFVIHEAIRPGFPRERVRFLVVRRSIASRDEDCTLNERPTVMLANAIYRCDMRRVDRRFSSNNASVPRCLFATNNTFRQGAYRREGVERRVVSATFLGFHHRIVAPILATALPAICIRVFRCATYRNLVHLFRRFHGPIQRLILGDLNTRLITFRSFAASNDDVRVSNYHVSRTRGAPFAFKWANNRPTLVRERVSRLVQLRADHVKCFHQDDDDDRAPRRSYFSLPLVGAQDHVGSCVVSFRVQFPFNYVRVLAAQFTSRKDPLGARMANNGEKSNVDELRVHVLPSLPNESRLLRYFRHPSILANRCFRTVYLVIVSSRGGFRITTDREFYVFVLGPAEVEKARGSFLVSIRDFKFVFSGDQFRVARDCLQLR